jgi:hypothetical protein
MPDIKNIADGADIIVNGYAFTREDDGIHVLNLNSPDKAVVFDTDGEVMETTRMPGGQVIDICLNGVYKRT